MQTMRPVLFYTVGLPGAGKTSFARNMAHWLAIEHLRGDKIGFELFRFPTFSPQERQMVYAEMGRRAGEHLQAGRHVLYDAAVNTRAQRQELTALAKKRAGRLRDANLAGPVARVIPPHIFDQYVAAFEAPTNEQNIIIVAGDAYFALQYRRLQRQLGGAVKAMPRLVQ